MTQTHLTSLKDFDVTELSTVAHVDRVAILNNMLMTLEGIQNAERRKEVIALSNDLFGDAQRLAEQAEQLSLALNIEIGKKHSTEQAFRELNTHFSQIATEYHELLTAIRQIDHSHREVREAYESIETDLSSTRTLDDVSRITENMGWEVFEVEELLTLLNIAEGEDPADYDLTEDALADFRNDLRYLVARTFDRHLA